MNVVRYFECPDRARLTEQIAACDWSAAKFLTCLLRDGTFHRTLGGSGDLFLLLDGDILVSFATLTGQDSVRDESLSPWIGFVYTAPAYRGRRLAGNLLAHIEGVAKADGHRRVYIATDYVGLYEKYGYTYLENRTDCWGDDQRILYKELDRHDR